MKNRLVKRPRIYLASYALRWMIGLPMALSSCAGSERGAAKVRTGVDADSTEANSLPFAWPFLEPEQQAWRGGTTQGKAVELDQSTRSAWTRLREEGLTSQERDRRAILAMAGEYRVSFQFVETFGATEDADYSPPAPYFSWGTEYVQVLTNEPGFVQLQHILVMYFDDPEYPDAMVMKHWRQDWRHRDGAMLSFEGERRWAPAKDTGKSSREGYWTQAVFQVDDSPRYETFGRWVHTPNMSRWRSAEHARPLPRREFSVRDDYDALVGRHVIRVLPYGWLHEQISEKAQTADGVVVAGEIGINRYESISAPSLAGPAAEYLEATGSYWGAVRAAWSKIEVQALAGSKAFSIRGKVDGQKLWERHFEMAGKLEKREVTSEEASRHASDTVEAYVDWDS